MKAFRNYNFHFRSSPVIWDRTKDHEVTFSASNNSQPGTTCSKLFNFKVRFSSSRHFLSKRAKATEQTSFVEIVKRLGIQGWNAARFLIHTCTSLRALPEQKDFCAPLLPRDRDFLKLAFSYLFIFTIPFLYSLKGVEMVGCSALGCSNSSARGYKMFRIPWNKDRRKMWAIAIRRRTADGELWIPGDSARICSQHFINGRSTLLSQVTDRYVAQMFNRVSPWFHRSTECWPNKRRLRPVAVRLWRRD